MSTSKPLMDPPAAVPNYRKIVERAKAQAGERPGPMQNTPRFDEPPPPPVAQAPRLSPQTVRGLESLAQAMPVPPAAPAPVQEPAPAAATVPVVEAPVSGESPLDETEQLRRGIEGRLRALDIGQYILNGELMQLVPVIPGKLEVRYRTVSEYEEGWVDAHLAKQNAANKEMTQRQFLRLMNECSLACHIHSVGGSAWPVVLNGDGTVNESHMEERLRRVRKFPSAVFALLTQNMGWFLERVSKALSAEALGNG